MSYAKIRIDLIKNFPVTVHGDNLPDRKHRKLLLKDMVSSEDLPFLINQIDDIFTGSQNILQAHARIMTNDGDYSWFLIRCEQIKEKFGRSYLEGFVFDVTGYLNFVEEDSALLEFKRREDEKAARAANRELTLTDVLDPDYLEQIQRPLTDEGVYSAICDNNLNIICTPVKQEESEKPFSFRKFKHNERTEIRISRVVAAYWVVASDDAALLGRFKSLHGILSQAVTRLANSFAMLYNETDNSEHANRLLSEHIEQQILINNVYNIILEMKDSSEALTKVIKLIGEYMGMRRVCVYEECKQEKLFRLIYEWRSPQSPEAARAEYPFSDLPKIKERLDYADMYLPPSGGDNKVFSPESCTVANLIGDGARFGIITFAPLKLGSVPTAQESKVLRSVSQITAALMLQKKADEEIKAKDDELKRLAFNDPVLNIPNRAMLEKDLAAELERKNNGFAAVVKITNLHTFNELFGHEYTDSMLRDVSGYIANMPHTGLTLYRYSGTALMFLCRGADENTAKELTELLLERFKKPWKQTDGAHYLDACVGIAVYPHEHNSNDAVYRACSLALYKAAEYGTNSYAFYTDEFKTEADINYSQAQKLRDYINDGMKGFMIKYQPVVTVEGVEKYPCYEALVSRADFPTTKLIQLAESMGLDIVIDKWVIKNACLFCKKMQEKEPGFSVSVNITPRVLRSGSIISMVSEALKESGLPGKFLLVEIPERVFADHQNSVLPIIKKLRETGVKLIIDSFGSDFGAFRLLRHSYMDMVKVDFSLFSNVFGSFDEIWVSSVSKLAASLENGICVKRVESAEQLEDARKYGVRYAQGLLFAKPMTEEEILKK